MAYLEQIFLENIKDSINTIVELGSRDLNDAKNLVEYFNSHVFSFECNPDCLELCYRNHSLFNKNISNKITIIPYAVALENSKVNFYPFDLTKYNNMGSSSMLTINFDKRDPSDPDYKRENPQKKIEVNGIRMDSFIDMLPKKNIDLVCIDLQGYELNAIKSFGDYISNVHYIITESSIISTYDGGATFEELNKYLSSKGFEYICSNKYGYGNIPTNAIGYSEFDCLFINNNYKT